MVGKEIRDLYRRISNVCGEVPLEDLVIEELCLKLTGFRGYNNSTDADELSPRDWCYATFKTENPVPAEESEKLFEVLEGHFGKPSYRSETGLKYYLTPSKERALVLQIAPSSLVY